MGLGCEYDNVWLDRGDDGTTYCLYCRYLNAEKERDDAREALAAMMRVIIEAGWLMDRLKTEMNATGVTDGFGVRLQKAIAAVERVEAVPTLTPEERDAKVEAKFFAFRNKWVCRGDAQPFRFTFLAGAKAMAEIMEVRDVKPNSPVPRCSTSRPTFSVP